MQVKNIGIINGFAKIRRFCAYQERCHREVKQKLYSFGLYKQEVENLVSQLIEDGYLNEERYAIAFAGGKFRIKQWGKVKIKYELKQKGISAYCINKGLASLGDQAYTDTLQQLFNAKLKTLKSEKNTFVRKRKIQSFLMQKGFESALIMPLLQKL